jgi:hypothetical protein
MDYVDNYCLCVKTASCSPFLEPLRYLDGEDAGSKKISDLIDLGGIGWKREWIDDADNNIS